MRFRFRLIGTKITALAGRDCTGKWVDDVYDDFSNTGAYHRMWLCAADGKPIFQRGKVISNPDCGGLQAERLYLPLASDGPEVDVILVMTIYLGVRAADAAYDKSLLDDRPTPP
jgi:hypothetical protein